MQPNLGPVRPIAPYIGGKRNLAKRLCALIDATPHRTYVEPFVGMGGVFFRRPRSAPVEVINDISTDVANLYRILQRHYVAFVDLLKWQITSRTEFERLMKVDATTLTDLERAARFLYLQRAAFGGIVVGRTFGISRAASGRFNITTLEPMLEDMRARLAPVWIERLPFADVIRRWDSPETLFYLDPPYWGCEDDYGPDVFDRDDFVGLADQLAAIAGDFILSINATAGAREVFGRFMIEEVSTTYMLATASAGRGTKVTELIVRGPIRS